MMVIISYDVSTKTKSGTKRLRKVAKACEAHAQRVQNSVFEADVDYSTFMRLKQQLTEIMNLKEDSMRFYYLGNNWHHRVEHIGVEIGYDPEGSIII